MNTKILLLAAFIMAGAGLATLQAQATDTLPNISLGGTYLVNQDINNKAQARKWQDVKRSVLHMRRTVGNTIESCSGFLVNTAGNSRHGNTEKLFVLTASHCLKPYNSSTVDFYVTFDYEASKAGIFNNSSNLFPSDIRVHYKVPFIKRVVDTVADIALLEVDVNEIQHNRYVEWKPCWVNNGIVDIFHPNSPFHNAYAIGWDLNAVLTKQNFTQIHHPSSDWKKWISPTDVATLSSFLSNKHPS
jgi:hypothetical protein